MQEKIKRYFTDSFLKKGIINSKLDSKKSLTGSNDLPCRVLLLLLLHRLLHRSSCFSLFLRISIFHFIIIDRRCKRRELIVNPTVPFRYGRRSPHRQSSLHRWMESRDWWRNRVVPIQRGGSGGDFSAVFVFFFLLLLHLFFRQTAVLPIRLVVNGIVRVRIGDGGGSVESRRVRKRSEIGVIDGSWFEFAGGFDFGVAIGHFFLSLLSLWIGGRLWRRMLRNAWRFMKIHGEKQSNNATKNYQRH